jgi:lipopolysaccharide transport system permease protein
MTSSAPSGAGAQPVIIGPADRWPWPTLSDAREIWQYRDLLIQLVMRDIRVRYAQTLLGAAWAVLQPVVSMAIFWVIFGYFAGVPSGSVPYALMALGGLVPWTYFATVVAASSESLLASRELVTKIYFPRLIIPLAPILAGLIDLAIGTVVLLVAVLFWQPSALSPALLMLPLPVLMIVTAAAGLGIWSTALNIQYRDIRYIIPFVLQTGLFLSPVIYPLAIAPERYRLLFALNPLTGAIESLRALVLGMQYPGWSVVTVSTLSAVLLFATGVVYFRRVEQLFADVA